MKRYLDLAPPKSSPSPSAGTTTSPRHNVKQEESSPLALPDYGLPPVRSDKHSSSPDPFAAGASSSSSRLLIHQYLARPSRASTSTSPQARPHSRVSELAVSHVVHNESEEHKLPSLSHLDLLESRSDRSRRRGVQPYEEQERLPDLGRRAATTKVQRMCQICDAMVDIEEFNMHLLEHSGDLPSRPMRPSARARRCQSCAGRELRPSALDDTLLLCSSCGAVQEAAAGYAGESLEIAPPASTVGSRETSDTLGSLMGRLSLPPLDEPVATRRGSSRIRGSRKFDPLPEQEPLQAGFGSSSLLGELPPLPALSTGMSSHLQSRRTARGLQRQPSLSSGLLGSPQWSPRPPNEPLRDLPEIEDETSSHVSRWSRRR